MQCYMPEQLLHYLWVNITMLRLTNPDVKLKRMHQL